MRIVAAVIDAVPGIGQLNARALVAEFARWTEEELDYRVEAKHAAVLRQNAADDPLERNPLVYADYTTARVLTMDTSMEFRSSTSLRPSTAVTRRS